MAQCAGRAQGCGCPDGEPSPFNRSTAAPLPAGAPSPRAIGEAAVAAAEASGAVPPLAGPQRAAVEGFFARLASELPRGKDTGGSQFEDFGEQGGALRAGRGCAALVGPCKRAPASGRRQGTALLAAAAAAGAGITARQRGLASLKLTVDRIAATQPTTQVQARAGARPSLGRRTPCCASGRTTGGRGALAREARKQAKRAAHAT